MEDPPGEERSEFLQPVEEDVVDNVIVEQEVHEEVALEDDMLQVEHEEVLEEIVEEDGLMYDTDGRVVYEEDMVVYEEGSEVIEEYVEVEDLGNGSFAYVMTDEHGNRRLLKPDEVEAVKKTVPELMEEVIVDPKAPGPSSSGGYANHKRGRFPPKPKQIRPNIRGHIYMDRDEYFQESSSKDINDITKIDVEKYIPSTTANRRPLPDNPAFKPKQPRSRKNPPWQDESRALSGGPAASVVGHSPTPMIKEPIFPAVEEDVIFRFKCPECEEAFPNMDRHCDHMVRNHDCQTLVREVDFFTDREFENFLTKVEKATLGKQTDDSLSKKSRPGSTQVFVCNYMTKDRQKSAELVEVGLSALAERPIEVCTAFVHKIHSYECIRVRYCDQHIHYDGNIGFRVPIAVKRRLFEMSFKRIPIPCMQVMLSLEAEQLLPHPTRFEEKLKNLSHVEVVELLGIINASLSKNRDPATTGKKVPIKFDTIKSSEGARTLVVKRMDSVKKRVQRHLSNEPSTSAEALGFPVDDQGVPIMTREEEILEDEDPTATEGCDGVMLENYLYDPLNDRDPLLEELTETELGVLDAYERDISIQLTEEQRKERIRQRTKYSLSKVVGKYQALDTATHGLTASELHTDTINQLREMASFVVELCCQLDAEVKAQYNPELRVEEIKRDMIAGIALQERCCQPERRQRRTLGSNQTPSPLKTHYRSLPPSRSHEEYTQRIMSKVKELQAPHNRHLTNIRDPFDMNQQQRLQLLRNRTLGNRTGSVEPEIEEKPSLMVPIPDDLKAVPWSKPQRKRHAADSNPAEKRKRGRPTKKGETTETIQKDAESTSDVTQETLSEKDSEQAVEIAESIEAVVQSTSSSDSTETATEKAVEEKSPENKKEHAETEDSADVRDEPSTSIAPETPPTKTRTGRVIKPKKWEDD
ncbi:hypothetical protein GCK72_005829 [Caenorhabditis remanei]|uniref:C2H2-type domain-containing protein n=1 Tax=Caenorhabditis remanei TaxID=31234 RepID=A0A6A5HGM0_CAERE|nr:hypothetical protein GCK72_005829 [Caenorhabditis remanei]KAF1765876.1 hypothetical protein GCK72_005829 [Caenorhabditis remanei]